MSGAGNRYGIDPWYAGIGATYFFPTGGRLRLGAGLAAGITSIRDRFEGPQFAFDARGSGPDLRATGEAMCPLARNGFASGTAGLRYARVPDIRLDHLSTNTPADFSGFSLHVAVGRDWPQVKNPR